jgi:hypothetical protein
MAGFQQPPLKYMTDTESNIPHISKRPHAIEEIAGDILAYNNPEYLIDSVSKLIDTTKTKKSDLERYSRLLSNIRYAWDKTKKYESYFSNFYPPEERISKIEALNHHIHAYLQDMDTLKNKIETLLDILHGDVVKKVTNKEEVKNFFSRAREKVEQSFDGVCKYRRPHTHHGPRFIDGGLLKAENAENFSQLAKSPVATRFINQEAITPLLKKLEQEKEEEFEAAKERWITMARKNNIQTTGLIDMILSAMKAPLYTFLKIKPMRDLHLNKE